MCEIYIYIVVVYLERNGFINLLLALIGGHFSVKGPVLAFEYI